MKFKCRWCGRDNRTMSDWEQQRLFYDEYAPLCCACAKRRLDNPYNALLPIRKRCLAAIKKGGE